MRWNEKFEHIFRKQRSQPHVAESNPEILNNTEIKLNEVLQQFGLNMLIIADTHGCLSIEDIPNDNFDVCLLLGDVYECDLRLIKESITNVPIYGILGNHDGFQTLNMYEIENIHNKIINIKGIKIAGIQGSLRYKNSDMPLYTDEESKEIASSLGKADILISHDSPKFLYSIDDYAHSGLQGITDYCENNNILLNIHGHHHENATHVLENGTIAVCCYGVRVLKGDANAK